MEKAACPNHLILVSCAVAWPVEPSSKKNRAMTSFVIDVCLFIVGVRALPIGFAECRLIEHLMLNASPVKHYYCRQIFKGSGPMLLKASRNLCGTPLRASWELGIFTLASKRKIKPELCAPYSSVRQNERVRRLVKYPVLLLTGVLLGLSPRWMMARPPRARRRVELLAKAASQ